MMSYLLNFLPDLILFLIGIVFSFFVRLVKEILPLRNLWKLQQPKELIVVVANSVNTDTGEYTRQATGIGQVASLALTIESLNKAYGTQKNTKIYMSDYSLKDKLENDLLLLGGEKNNEISRELLRLLDDVQPIKQVGSTVYWRDGKAHNWVENDENKYYGEVRDGKVVTDYGIIIRAKNPFVSKASTAVFIAGSHTYGTVAAAKYFIELANNDLGFFKLRNQNIAILVKTDVIGGYPVNIRRINDFTW